MIFMLITPGCALFQEDHSADVPNFGDTDIADYDPLLDSESGTFSENDLDNFDTTNGERPNIDSFLIPKSMELKNAEQEPNTKLPELTLCESQRHALFDSPDVVGAIARLDEAHAQIMDARADYYPQLKTQFDLFENYDFDSANTIAQATPINRATGSSTDEYLDFYANVRLLLFDGFVRKRTLEAAKLESKYSEVGIREAQRLLIEEVNSVYFAAVLAQLRMEIAEKDVRFNNYLKFLVTQRRQAGDASKSDVLNFKVKAGEAERSYIEMRREFGVLLAALSSLMNLPTPLDPNNTRLVVPDALDKIEDDLSLESAFQFAWNNRQDILQMKIELERNLVEQNIERGKYWPEVSIDSNYSIGLLEFETDVLSNPSQSGASGMVVRWNTLDGGRRTANVQKKVAQGGQLNASLQKARQNLQAQLAALLQEIRLNRELVANQTETLAAATESRDLVMNLYASGLVSITRMNEAQQDYIRSANSLITARVRLYLAWENLQTAMGRIGPWCESCETAKSPQVAAR